MFGLKLKRHIEKLELKSVKFKIFADPTIINGTVKIDNKLITAVKDIERATSPFANFVNTFEVTPPGAEAIIIIPGIRFKQRRTIAS